MSAYADLACPPDFDFQACLTFLGRSDREILHAVQDGTLIRPFRCADGLRLLEICQGNGQTLRVRQLAGPAGSVPAAALAEIREIFDLDRDLAPFYAALGDDPVMGPLLGRYRGLRVIRIPDLFEALSWTIIGQQINLGFAYSMKARLVQACGPSIAWNGRDWFAFPAPDAVAGIRPETLREMQYSRQKTDYLLTLAAGMAAGHPQRGLLEALSAPEGAERELLALRGIGPWSASYVLLKCLGDPDGFPMGDAGLHNALKAQLGLPAKPDLPAIRKMSKPWAGWRGYCTFFLWRSLISE